VAGERPAGYGLQRSEDASCNECPYQTGLRFSVLVRAVPVALFLLRRLLSHERHRIHLTAVTQHLEVQMRSG
jgi:hypothetical protein